MLVYTDTIYHKLHIFLTYEGHNDIPVNNTHTRTHVRTHARTNDHTHTHRHIYATKWGHGHDTQQIRTPPSNGNTKANNFQIALFCMYLLYFVLTYL